MKKTQKAKLKEFQKYLRSKDIDVAFFYNIHLQEFDPNFYYFSDYDGVGFLVVPKRKKPFLIVPEMECLRAKKQSSVDIVVAKIRLVKVLRKKIGSAKKIGVDKRGMTLAFFDRFKKELAGLNVKYTDIGKKCVELRTVKTAEELRRIRKACKITDKIFSETFANFKKFKTEAEVSAFMINKVNKSGLNVAFKPIVATGSNAAEPHHGSRDMLLKKGFCVIDFGIRYRGYCSDMTRTLYIGKPSAKDLKLYDMVLDAQMKAIESVAEGVLCKVPSKIVRSLFGNHEKYFTSSLGHGIGLEVHEEPLISKRENKKFVAGMVHTLEPGIYIPNRLGIRIEDDLIVTKKGVEIITKTGKNLLVI